MRVEPTVRRRYHRAHDSFSRETKRMIRDCHLRDAARVRDIYNHYIENTIVTFEESPLSEDDCIRRMEEITAAYPWIVHEEDGHVTGYAYAGPWKPRCSFRHTAEATVYLDPACLGRGIGTALYRELLARLESRGLHCVIGGISLPNAASVALHEKFGFQKIGHFREIGWKFERWIDVGYWELMLEPQPSPNGHPAK